MSSVKGSSVLFLNSFQSRQKGTGRSARMCRYLAAKRRDYTRGNGSSFERNAFCSWARMRSFATFTECIYCIILLLPLMKIMYNVISHRWAREKRKEIVNFCRRNVDNFCYFLFLTRAIHSYKTQRFRETATNFKVLWDLTSWDLHWVK